MSGLSLIGEYSSNSDNDDSSPSQNIPDGENTGNRLPLPQSIKLWKGVDHHLQIEDDPSKHEGRIRSFKHERGNWATLVYILYEPSESLRTWMNLIKSQYSLDGKFFNEFHISLTRTLALKFHWIDSFIEGLKKICDNTNYFTLELIDVKVYSNDDKTRTFLGIACINDQVLEILTKALNKLLKEYQLPSFYEEASHHISFFWSLNDKEIQWRAHLPSISSSLLKFLSENPQEKFLSVSKLHCRIGNRFYQFNLRPFVNKNYVIMNTKYLWVIGRNIL